VTALIKRVGFTCYLLDNIVPM